MAPHLAKHLSTPRCTRAGHTQRDRGMGVPWMLLGGLLLLAVRGSLAEAAEASSINRMKQLSLEELMALEVSSVSRRSENLLETASAVQVISGAEIRRSAATNIPEALRLMPNVRVAQANSYAWVVSTRGFSGLFANKLLALVDGRAVYTPLFAGVLWDVQNVPLEDIDRIEAVSGPGGTLWGANAVNGIISITTKSARDTPGAYLSAAAGPELEHSGGVRYGGQAGPNLYYRVHAQSFDRGPTVSATGGESADGWEMKSGGGRMDWYPDNGDVVTLQGDLYGGQAHTRPGPSELRGGNLLGRWTRTLPMGAEASLQVYFDRTWRDSPADLLQDELKTYDLDFQHRFPAGDAHTLLWGAGYRRLRSSASYTTPLAGYLPQVRDMDLFSGFLQDEVTVCPNLTLTAGTKLEHNAFSGFEVQPGVRAAWIPGEGQTVWAAVSRAVRSPSRIDVDLHIPGMEIEPGAPGVDGGPNFDSEKVVAYELGYRVQPMASLFLSIAAFYNDYDDLYSVEALPGTPTFQIQNGTEGESWGAEISGSWQPASWWRLRGGYTFFQKQLGNKPGHFFDPSSLGNDPENQWLLHSIVDLPAGWELDVTARYVGSLPNPPLSSYWAYDARLAWLAGNWEIALVGQNLGDPHHPEFGMQQIRRSIFGRVTVRW